MSSPNDPNEPPVPPPPGGYGAPPPGSYGTPPAGGYGTPPQPGGYPPPAPEAYGAPPTSGGYAYQPMPSAGGYGYPAPQPGLQRAGFGRRFVAVIIDGIVVGVITAILATILGIDIGTGNSVAGNGSVSSNFNLRTGYNLLNAVITVLYWGGMEGFMQGRTLGKMALGIAVRDINTGAPLPVGRAFVRAVGRLVSGAVCLLGYLWMLWDGQKQTWHDKFANSTVVKL